MTMSATCFLALSSNTLYLHSNFIINPKTLPFPKSFKFITFSSKSSDCQYPSKNGENCIGETENQNYVSPPSAISHSTSTIKGPTAPWMKGPLLVEPNHVLDLSKARKKKDTNFAKTQNPGDALSGKVSGGRGKETMKKIFQGIEKLQDAQNLESTKEEIDAKVQFQFPPGSLADWTDLSFQFEEQTTSEEIEFNILPRESEERKGVGRMPWESEERTVYRRMKEEKDLTVAELNIDAMLLERLRGEAARIQKWVKVKKAGVTQAVVDQIHLIWNNNELAMLKFDLPLCRNMDRAREIIEMKTGGLVVWRKKNVLVVYRGCDYTFRQNYHYSLKRNDHPEVHHDFRYGQQSSVDETIIGEALEEESLTINESLYEREADRLLDDLGPRYVDWWWPKPLPVDADLLPEVVPGFKLPFRLCPPRSSSKLRDDELTHLRKQARSLPTHFVLGRNRRLQGLAAAIVKLWEKCHIAKIALKWGIPNTSNELMANELKYLTGGVLILRNKFFIIIYRGKDFLPCQVASLVAEREAELRRCQLQEEAARYKAIETLPITTEESTGSSNVGTLSEFNTITETANLRNEKFEVEVQLVAEKERLDKELRNQQHSLYTLKKKIQKSSKALEKLNAVWQPAKQDGDREIITQEEKASLRQIGLKMDRSLVLGRRGVFDGVVVGIHQHWKHREVVKVITMQKIFSHVVHSAKLLEAESGGILVSVDKLKEGHAIIIYRGKNYRRPTLVPQNLLNKRQALSRSLEMQRLGSLKFFANQTEDAISDLKCKLVDYTAKIGQVGDT